MSDFYKNFLNRIDLGTGDIVETNAIEKIIHELSKDTNKKRLPWSDGPKLVDRLSLFSHLHLLSVKSANATTVERDLNRQFEHQTPFSEGFKITYSGSDAEDEHRFAYFGYAIEPGHEDSGKQIREETEASWLNLRRQKDSNVIVPPGHIIISIKRPAQGLRPISFSLDIRAQFGVIAATSEAVPPPFQEFPSIDRNDDLVLDLSDEHKDRELFLWVGHKVDQFSRFRKPDFKRPENGSFAELFGMRDQGNRNKKISIADPVVLEDPDVRSDDFDATSATKLEIRQTETDLGFDAPIEIRLRLPEEKSRFYPSKQTLLRDAQYRSVLGIIVPHSAGGRRVNSVSLDLVNRDESYTGTADQLRWLGLFRPHRRIVFNRDLWEPRTEEIRGLDRKQSNETTYAFSPLNKVVKSDDSKTRPPRSFHCLHKRSGEPLGYVSRDIGTPRLLENQRWLSNAVGLLDGQIRICGLGDGVALVPELFTESFAFITNSPSDEIESEQLGFLILERQARRYF